MNEEVVVHSVGLRFNGGSVTARLRQDFLAEEAELELTQGYDTVSVAGSGIADVEKWVRSLLDFVISCKRNRR